MKILLLGANGQVGWELQRSLSPLGDVMALDRSIIDLSELGRLRAILQGAQADMIVNAAAYTAVDKAETDRKLATVINADAPGVMAEEAARAGSLLVHYSTDYVFDGQKIGAYVETDRASPLNHYGATKLQGEEAIRATNCRHLIFRTSWVYAPRGKNFPRTILNLAKTRDLLTVVSDQVGAPTSAELIADVTAQALGRLRHDLLGTYHLTAGGETSWHVLAQKLLRLAAAQGHKLKVGADQVRPIPAADYPTPAKRIANSRLNTHKLKAAFGLSLPAWDAHLHRFLDELPPEGAPAT